VVSSNISCFCFGYFTDLIMEPFGIQIEDGSTTIPSFVVEQNTSSMQLYSWQTRAINYFFNNNYKAIFEVTTGAGKTFCAIEIIKRLLQDKPDLQVLIVVPKNIILETGWYKELYDAGISLRDIGVYYGSVKEYAKITITNMQNIHRIALDIFDMVIFDEIHNYGTKRLLPYIEYKFKYKIGLSATIERRDDKHWQIIKAFDYNVFKYTPHEALSDNVLNPFYFVNVGIEMDDDSYDRYLRITEELNTIFQMGGGFNKIMRTGSGLKFRMLAKMNERKDLINNYPRKFDMVKNIVEEHKKEKIIVFNEYNAQTNKSYWYLLDIGVKACIIHSGIENNKRQQNITDFKNDKYNVVLTSKVLDEGYNLPKLDVAIIAAGNSTAKQTIQRMGRVLRKKNKPSMLYQIYCLNTVEEDYAFERTKIFKELCSGYKEKRYTTEGEVI